jgi:hypothetical protein
VWDGGTEGASEGGEVGDEYENPRDALTMFDAITVFDALTMFGAITVVDAATRLDEIT